MSRILRGLVISIILASPVLVGLVNFPAAPLRPANAVTRNMTLEGWSGGWNQTSNRNPTIIVMQGDSISLSLPNRDGAPHQFFIDVDANLALPPNCPPDKCSDSLPANFPFTVNFEPGNYRYYCAYHSEQMWGDFVVQGFTVFSNRDSLRVIRASSNMSTITVTSVNNFAGTVNLTATVSPSGPTAGLYPTNVALSPDGSATSVVTVSANSDVPIGTSYVVTVKATSGSSSSSRGIVTLVVEPDFSISADPTLLTIPLDSSQNSVVTLTSRDTFFGQVDLTTSTLPTSITATMTPDSVNLMFGGTATSMLNVTVTSLTMPGTYVVNVTGTSGYLTHTTTITLVAGPDFGIAPNPAALTLTPGSSGTSTISLASFNSFSGTVELTGAVSPGGPDFSLSPQSLSLSGDGSAAALLVVNASSTTVADAYTVTVTATSGPTVHTIRVTVSVTDFSITVPNTNLILQQGSSITTTISITSINGFVGDVNLATASSANALSQLLNVTTMSLNSSALGFASLTVNAASAPRGTYTVSITGTSGSLARSVSMSVTVQPSQGGASILPLVGGVGGIVAGAIAIAMAGAYLMRRGKLRRRATG